MLLGVYTGLHDQIAVQDLGIDNLTAADGLAVGRASGFVGRAMERLLDGFYTLDDQTMYDMLGWLATAENIRLEPSALAGMAGPQRVCASKAYHQLQGLSEQQLQQATHWCGPPAAEWCRKRRWRSIWRRGANLQRSSGINASGGRCCRRRSRITRI